MKIEKSFSGMSDEGSAHYLSYSLFLLHFYPETPMINLSYNVDLQSQDFQLFSKLEPFQLFSVHSRIESLNKVWPRWSQGGWRGKTFLYFTFAHSRDLYLQIFEMMTSHGFWDSDKTLFNSREQGNNGL